MLAYTEHVGKVALFCVCCLEKWDSASVVLGWGTQPASPPERRDVETQLVMAGAASTEHPRISPQKTSAELLCQGDFHSR